MSWHIEVQVDSRPALLTLKRALVTDQTSNQAVIIRVSRSPQPSVQSLVKLVLIRPGEGGLWNPNAQPSEARRGDENQKCQIRISILQQICETLFHEFLTGKQTMVLLRAHLAVPFKKSSSFCLN